MSILRRRADLWATSLFAAIGLLPLSSCGGKSQGGDDGDGSGATGSSGPTSNGTGGTVTTPTNPGRGGRTSGQAGTSTGGQATGGTGTGGVVSNGGASANAFPCENPIETSAGYFSCEGGGTIRTEQLDCQSQLPRPDPVQSQGSMYDQCQYDTDCTTGPYGYCSLSFNDGSEPSTYCAYGCTTDVDCGEGMICHCSDPVGYCVEAHCTTSADCLPGFHCAAYDASPGCGGQAFTCQTSQDECLSDADCMTETTYAVCTRHYETGAHICSGPTCAIGRPFLVDEVARVARTARRSDWLAGGLCPELESLSPDLRQRLAHEWTRAGQLEHASIAAFSRFLLELMAFGAPSELVAETISAIEDERQHAQICFALASEYAGEGIGPGRLDVEGALERPTLARSLSTAVREGCIGETVAALEASELAAHVADPLLQQVLERIAADERRHAELAWKFAQWAVAQDAALALVLEQELALVREMIDDYDPLTTGPRTQELARAGVMPEALRTAVRDEALRKIVEPGLVSMIEQARRRTLSAA